MKKIILSGDVGWEITVDDIRKKLDEAAGADIDVHLASPGGSVFQGIEIFNLFRDYKREHPAAQMMLTIKGEAASMASYIAVNPAWDLIAAEDNAVLMIHNAWGGVVGDYREVGKMAEILDGLTGIIGKAYSAKTKKSVKDIRKLMDEESWYFGDEMMSAGFVDEIIKTETAKDRAGAVASARLKFSAMSQKLQAITATDLTQIAAMIKPESETGSNPATTRDNNNIQEVNVMTLAEFLASTPTAKIEYDAALKNHGDERFEAGRKAVQERIAGAMNYLKGDSAYPAPIKNLAVDVIDGKCEMSSLTAAVATYDSIVEKKNADDAKKETDVNGGKIKPDGAPQPSADGTINNEVDFLAAVNRAKAEKGMEVK
jgi:ATP-dependent protease ClpP protease subunit